MGPRDVQVAEVRAVALVHVVVRLEEGGVRRGDAVVEEHLRGELCGAEGVLAKYRAEDSGLCGRCQLLFLVCSPEQVR